MLPGVKQRIDQPGTTDLIAHDLYLKARRSYYVNTGQGMEEVDRGLCGGDAARPPTRWPMPASPRRGSTRSGSCPSLRGGARQRQGRAEHALALDEDIAEAHAALAYAKFYTWDWPGAEAGFKRRSSSIRTRCGRSTAIIGDI